MLKKVVLYDGKKNKVFGIKRYVVTTCIILVKSRYPFGLYFLNIKIKGLNYTVCKP